jgi:DNA-binding CsgD family transcriptional regulator
MKFFSGDRLGPVLYNYKGRVEEAAVSKSDLLRVQDVREAYRLIGDCRDLGADPALWQPRMLEGMCRLVGVPVAAGGEGRWIRPHQPVQAISAFSAGLDDRGIELLTAYHRDLGPHQDPIFKALQQIPGRLVTRSRRQLVSDAVWYRSRAWEYERPIGIDEQLTSVYQMSADGAIVVLALHRAAGERGFSAREQRLASFFFAELGRLVGTSLVSAAEPGPDKLSPRLRQTLAYLVEGDSEKQVAARLGLSRATTHQYVTALYRHFKVRSRGQLLAHIIKRMGRTGTWTRRWGSGDR